MAARCGHLVRAAGLRRGSQVGPAGRRAGIRLSASGPLATCILFVDEAAQMSLANVLAVSQAARTVLER